MWKTRRNVLCSAYQLRGFLKERDIMGIMAPAFGHFMQILGDAISKQNEADQRMKRDPTKELCLEIGNVVNTESTLFMHTFSPKQN